MSLTEHLLTNKVIAMDGLFTNETAIKLYLDMTENAVFAVSEVSDQRGDLNATVDTSYSNVVNSGRVSETAWATTFTQQSREMLADIVETVAGLLGVETNQFEPWQCTRYFVGGKFDYHDDCGNWASNERLYTVMYTVRAADFGGGTHFRKLGLTIPSQSNRLIIWRNLDENFLCDGKAEHSGMPVGDLQSGLDDEKMILVTWIRRFEYVQ